MHSKWSCTFCDLSGSVTPCGSQEYTTDQFYVVEERDECSEIGVADLSMTLSSHGSLETEIHK